MAFILIPTSRPLTGADRGDQQMPQMADRDSSKSRSALTAFEDRMTADARGYRYARPAS